MIGKFSPPPDYHSHTELCKHARGRPLDYARAAGERGVPELACTDHGPVPDGYDPEHRMTLDQFEQYEAGVREAREQGPVPVLFGVETDYYPGGVEWLGPWLKRQDFDIVLGSVHYLDFWAFDNPAQRSLWETVDVAGAWKKYFSLIAGMARSGLYDVASHLDLPKKFGYRPRERQVREMVLPVLDVIAASGMAIEINTSGLHVPVKEMYPAPEILAWAAERDIPLTFGSDAHDPARVGADFDRAVALARDAGYSRRVSLHRRVKTSEPLP
jgi:histidinol-phosphatase (PHP family)